MVTIHKNEQFVFKLLIYFYKTSTLLCFTAFYHTSQIHKSTKIIQNPFYTKFALKKQALKCLLLLVFKISGRQGSCLVRSRLTAIPRFAFVFYNTIAKLLQPQLARATRKNSFNPLSQLIKKSHFRDSSLLAGDEAVLTCSR